MPNTGWTSREIELRNLDLNLCPSLSPRIQKMENLVIWHSGFGRFSVTEENNDRAGRSRNILLTRDQGLAGLGIVLLIFTGKFF
jgi:hypothetical protein